MIIPHLFWFFSVLFNLNEKTVLGQKSGFSFNYTEDCECGTYNDVKARIVGGTDTQPHEYPWMVALFYKGHIHCGGSLISNRYILTAGHCLKWVNIQKLTVVLGVHDRILFERAHTGGVVVEIEEAFVHEGFTSYPLFDDEDIGLIKLQNPVQFNEKIKPICLPTFLGETYSNEKALITGWGKISENENPSRFLRKGDVVVVSNNECKEVPSLGQYIINSMLCGYKIGVDTCQGDSGGPMVYKRRSGKMEQIGIVSWGIGCAKPGLPGVYVRVTSYVEWIASKTADSVYCKNSITA